MAHNKNRDHRRISDRFRMADWEAQIIKKLSAEFKGSLPTVEEIEAELTWEGRQE